MTRVSITKEKLIDAYETLGVAHNPTAEEIDKAWKALVKKYHPDTNPDVDEETVKKINTAHDLIKQARKDGITLDSFASPRQQRPRTRPAAYTYTPSNPEGFWYNLSTWMAGWATVTFIAASAVFFTNSLMQKPIQPSETADAQAKKADNTGAQEGEKQKTAVKATEPVMGSESLKNRAQDLAFAASAEFSQALAQTEAKPSDGWLATINPAVRTGETTEEITALPPGYTPSYKATKASLTTSGVTDVWRTIVAPITEADPLELTAFHIVATGDPEKAEAIEFLINSGQKPLEFSGLEAEKVEVLNGTHGVIVWVRDAEQACALRLWLGDETDIAGDIPMIVQPVTQETYLCVQPK